MKLPHLAETFKELIEYGKAGFYEGRVANAIIDIIDELGGVMELSDLKNHNSEFVKPISTKNIEIMKFMKSHLMDKAWSL